MDKFMSVLVVFGVVAAVLLQCTAAQTVHVVGGDSLNWTVPSGNSGAYATWAASQKFVVGDTLVFNFATNEHDVLEVEKESYDACSSDKAIGSIITTGPATINLNSTGNHYYICTVGQHCKSGQKLSITVSASSGASPPSGSTPAPPPPPTTTTPSSPSPTSADCVPPPASSPKAGGPTGQTTPPPPNSSSSGVFASFFVCFFSIVIGFFF